MLASKSVPPSLSTVNFWIWKRGSIRVAAAVIAFDSFGTFDRDDVCVVAGWSG